MMKFAASVGSTLREWTSSLFDRFFTALLEGALDGLEIETRYHALSRKSTPDLAKLGLTREDIGQTALKDTYRKRQISDEEERPAARSQTFTRAVGAARLRHRRAV